MFKTSPRQQCRDCVIGLGMSAYSNMFINHASCIPFLFIQSLYATFFNSQDFYFTFLHSFLSVKGGKPPIKLIIDKNACWRHANDVIRKFDLHACYTVSKVQE